MAEARSPSRGRNDLVSTGRGGGGNFVRSESTSRTRREAEGDERGRDIFALSAKTTHAGRGGQGNIRSPSRDASKEIAERAHDEEVLRRNRELRADLPVSSGRGGTGNMSTEVSRSRSREPRISTESGVGRGGIGNIEEAKHFHHHGHGELEKLEEEERIDALKHEGVVKVLHSSGRGGEGNMTKLAPHEPIETEVAPPAPGVVNHVGRGGAGNIEVP